jgi:pimeloyl-ACP methyl ester carboxylesterase
LTHHFPAGYAPFGLRTDAHELGLSAVTVRSGIGTAVAHFRRTRPSSRATIFLHGAAGSWTTWTPLLRAADEAEVTIDNPVLLDLPGFGDATLTTLADGSSDSLTVDAICALVKDCAEELGFTEWDLVGHSMGGFVALHMAAIWPQCVLSVGVVSGTGASIIDSLEHPARNFRLLPAFTLLWGAMVILGRFGTAGAAPIRAVRRLGLLRWAVSPLFRYPRRIPRSVVHALGDELQPRIFALAAGVARGYDLTRWRHIECDVHALGGDNDVFSTFADLQQLTHLIPRCVATVVPDCGHFAAIERPAAVLDALGYTVTLKL